MATDVRPMTLDDIDAAINVQARSFDDLELRLGEPVEGLDDERRERMRIRFTHLLTSDPQGSWIGLVDGRIAGVALAMRRDSLWGLSLLVIDPGVQSAGLGRRLVDASLTHAAGCDRAVILSSPDPRAMRLYATSGFDLYPQVYGHGNPDRSALPGLGTRVRAGTVADADWADAIDAGVRGAGRGPDHARLATDFEMFIADDVDGKGYGYVRPDGEVAAIAATDDQTATALLWRCLAHVTELGVPAAVHHINGLQQWAVRTAYQARILLKPDGPVFYRGMTPPPSYLPSGAYL